MKRVSTVAVRKRIVAVFLIGLVVFFVINIRLGYVQFFLADELIKKANDSWSRDIKFEAERGRILDVNGEVLTKNVSAPSVILVPSQIKNKEDTAEKLASVLDITNKKAYEYVTEKRSKVSIHPKGRKISKKQAKTLQTYNMEGVYLAKDSKRYYPHGAYLSHVLGFTGIDNQGLMGLELYYNDKLSGTPGSLSYYSTAKGARLDDPADVYKAPVDGLTLKTTINSKVQTIIERELDLAVAKYSPDGASAIAVNPKTGGIIAMSSRPNFKPGQYKKFDPTIYSRNLPIWSTYEPGSTFKIITLAAALEENAVNLQKDTFNDDGEISVGGAKLHCWKSGGHGHQTYLEVVQNSCNPGFVNLGMKLGQEKLFSYIRDFGFGEETGIDLQGESSGILFKPEQVGPVELATTSFGQGVSVTPIQQVMAVSAAVNGGNLMEPHIAKEWIDPVTKDVVEKVEPKVEDTVISGATSEKIRNALESVVAKGTGRPAFVEGYRVGGKTGTAQKVGPDGRYMQNNYVLSFIGFAPADDPEIVVYLAIDNPKDTVQFGGVVAAPIVGTIIGDSLSAMGVEKRTDGLAKEYKWPEEPEVTVPDLIGLKKGELADYLTTLSIKTSGEGKYIVDQEPSAGTKVESGSKMRIYLSDEK
ncbi:stage V sporulation protein D [Virgibacillus phasianinus]|uniref:serine-type D-Ala-D-Ala carboxypeptidase n=1 Tax=Virgibacillus phasianinus TaxID=2017483 RepID=A0A220U6Q9_9BACI|nr:stage V sporulation protein D [Virgibacillus phasianinus]ASK63586.1 stage V sporulation protein D [Virgibacillus phasianinus]